jgi:hypothetical protein
MRVVRDSAGQATIEWTGAAKIAAIPDRLMADPHAIRTRAPHARILETICTAVGAAGVGAECVHADDAFNECEMGALRQGDRNQPGRVSPDGERTTDPRRALQPADRAPHRSATSLTAMNTATA